MSKYRSFSDIEKIDKYLAAHFKQRGDVAVRWCMSIEGPVAQWVKRQKRGEGGKSLYEVVRFASVRKGIFDESLSRTELSEIFVKFCPDAFRTPKNAISYDPAKEAKALRISMEHCKYIDNFKTFDLQPDSSILRGYVREIEALIDGQELPPPPSPKLPTIEERLEAYLRKDVAAHASESVYQIVDVKKDFGNGIVPDLSVSKYMSKRLLDECKPSNVFAYVFHHNKLTTDEVHAYYSKYESKRNIKLFVVSPIAFDREVIRLATEKYIGLVLVNPNEEMTEDSYIVQRSIEDYTQRQLDMDVLTGLRPMNTSLMIIDGESSRLTSSLADSLVYNGIAVAPGLIIKAPAITNEYIEEQADKLTHNQVVELVKNVYPLLTDPKILKDWQKLVTDILRMEIDPSVTAKELGIAYEYSQLASKEQLGYIDIAKETIFLKPIENNYARDRFTFAHELGHYILHLSCFKHYCYSSVGESSVTIGEITALTRNELQWFEHQANHFAACFLMPKNLVSLLYCFLYHEYVHKKYGDPLGSLYYNPLQPETYYSYANVVLRLAELLRVSSQAMTFRLKNMGLLRMPSPG